MKKKQQTENNILIYQVYKDFFIKVKISLLQGKISVVQRQFLSEPFPCFNKNATIRNNNKKIILNL